MIQSFGDAGTETVALGRAPPGPAGPAPVTVVDDHREGPLKDTMTRPTHRPPTHPGERLLENVLKPLKLTRPDLAARLQVSSPPIKDIIHGHRGIPPDTALRLSTLFGTAPEFGLTGPRNCDWWHAMRAPEVNVLRMIKPRNSLA